MNKDIFCLFEEVVDDKKTIIADSFN